MSLNFCNLKNLFVPMTMFPDLENEEAWRENRYHETFDLSINGTKERGHVLRIHVDSWTAKDFREQVEEKSQIVIIQGAMTDWPAMKSWTLDHLGERFRNQRFKVGDDDDDRDISLKLKYYLAYLNTTKDDSPLYMFDQKYGEHPIKKSLLDDYSIPKFFTDDLFKYVGEKDRPPYRWVLVGPPRSGTTIHIDPLGTSAWNALISGHKRWILFPPNAPKHLVRIPENVGRHRNEGITWFSMIYPKTQLPDWPEEFKPVELVQKPGEIIFVPAGWWHAVLNLDTTIAVTQNFCSRTNFPIVYHTTAIERPKFAKKWLAALQNKVPSLARLATLIDLKQSSGIHLDSGSISDEESEEVDDPAYRDNLRDLSSEETTSESRKTVDKLSGTGTPSLTPDKNHSGTETAATIPQQLGRRPNSSLSSSSTSHSHSGSHDQNQDHGQRTRTSSAERDQNVSKMCGRHSALCDSFWGSGEETTKRVVTEL